MTSPDDAVHEAAGDDRDVRSHSEAIFLRGLSLGALIGAAIAGSAIWERRRARHAADPAAGPRSSAAEPGGDEPNSAD